MKKMWIYILTILISAFIPVYLFFLWEPLKSTEVMNSDLIEEEIIEREIKTYGIENSHLSNGIFNNVENLSNNKKEKLNSLISELAIVDIIKVSNHLSDINNKEEVKNGFSLLSKRMSKEKYEDLMKIISGYINLE